MVAGYVKPNKQVKIYTIVVTHPKTGEIIRRTKPFYDMIKAARCYDIIDAQYGDKYAVRIDTIIS